MAPESGLADAGGPSMSQPASGRQAANLPCAVILTALQLEIRAVLEHLDGVGIEYDRYGTAYSCGVFSCGDVKWKVAVAECGPGNQDVAQIANYAINRYEPAALLLRRDRGQPQVRRGPRRRGRVLEGLQLPLG
jgi:hypothetical protein